MPKYRRAIIPGGTFFFTVVTYKRRPLFEDPRAVSILGSVIRRCKMRSPFEIPAIVVLPDHWHAIWNLPAGDHDYSSRHGWIKQEFTRRWLSIGGSESEVSAGKKSKRRRGVWQPRFWEHTIEDDEDFDRHFDYIHWNPVKHGLVECPKDWQHSSFHRWVRHGVYPKDWGCGVSSKPKGVGKIKSAGEP